MPSTPRAGDWRPDPALSLSELADKIRQQRPWLVPGDERDRQIRAADEARRAWYEERRAGEVARAATWSLQHPGGVATLDDLVPEPWKPARDLLQECYELLKVGHSEGEILDSPRSRIMPFRVRRGWRIDFGLSPDQTRSSISGTEQWRDVYYVHMFVDRRLVIPATVGHHKPGLRPARLSQLETWAFLAKGYRIQGGGAFEKVQTVEKLRLSCAEVLARSIRVN
jgi:hypothetical protein